MNSTILSGSLFLFLLFSFFLIFKQKVVRMIKELLLFFDCDMKQLIKDIRCGSCERC